MSKTTSHILNAASNLLGISIVLITGIKVTGHSNHTMADEIAWLAALCFALSCLLSYLDLRAEPEDTPHERRADRLFMAGLAALIIAAAVLAFSDFTKQSSVLFTPAATLHNA
ncbi:hypothetical protein [Sphingobium nicotianae]|uniref:Uncharacterized protein n=1 Tax=Sphingobium nicotianae TaxID=2782607 RepID=A0A9X1DF02_9SPHN|nr:hypothetical protein [Sphingobium nicotianae]MBT2188987.1 hypothetical protein [Sphingobium nicotianae]